MGSSSGGRPLPPPLPAAAAAAAAGDIAEAGLGRAASYIQLTAADAPHTALSSPLPTGRYLSEDYMFLRRWRDLGGRVFADLNVTLAHHGSHPFLGRASLAYTFDPVGWD